MSSPSPKPRWSSRMGGALRRTSTLLTIGRPSTPSRENDSDGGSETASLRRSTSRSSLSKTAALAPPEPALAVSAPSPIAESPAREAAATQQEVIGPSPLAKQASAAPESTEAVVTTLPEPAQAPESATSPTGYIPPPVVDSSAGNPGAFTDDLEELPQPKVAVDPYAASNTGPPPPVEEVVEAKPEVAPQPVVEDPVARPEATAAPAQAQAPAVEKTPSYFNKPMAESMKSSESLIPPPTADFAEAVDQNTALGAPAAKDEAAPVPATQAHEPDYEHGEAASYYRGDPSMPVPEPHHAEPEHEAEDERPQPQQPEPEVAQHIVHAPAPVQLSTAVMPSFDLPEYSQQEIWGGAPHSQEEKPHDVWAGSSRAPAQGSYQGGMPIPIPVLVGGAVAAGNGHASYHGESSIRMPNPHPESTYADPFADPVAPAIAITHSDAPHMPRAEISEQHQQAPAESHNDAHGIIVMPLPPMSEVVNPQAMHRVPSHESHGGSRINLETDETLPLLGRQTGKKANYLNSSSHDRGHGASSTHHVSVSPLAPSPSSWTPHGSRHPRLHELGWLEYHLPDGTVYYVHPTHRITTDLNLRAERLLTAVSTWLNERRDESPAVGVEGWLKEVKDPKKATKSGWGRKPGKSEAPVVLERFSVDHHVRTVVKEDEEERRFAGFGRNHAYSNGHGGHGKGKKQATAKVEEDQLDLEYRYWAFMEAHPAHTTLPTKARTEAVDVLTWAWTDRLLPSHRSIPAPFSQEECQELISILRSFNGDNQQDDHGIQTRVVARILLRVAQWRQTYFRPNKPLPKDVGTPTGALPVHRRPFRRAVFDLLISCLCLGIPYLFIERARLATRAADQESGLRHSSPMLIIGACTCLVAAIVLSASVTFLSLPGLDGVARTAGMVAVLFAAGAIAATGVAVLRHKADLERPISRVGIEGLMVVTRRTMALSLPTVFLSYSLIAFVTGLVLYVYRGASLTDPSLPKSSFEEYTKWTVVGVVGALAGMVTTSMLLLRG